MAGLVILPGTTPAWARAASQLRTAASSRGGKRATLLLSTLALILLLFWIVSAMLPDRGRPVLPGLVEAERAEATEVLRNAGFKPRLDAATGEILVSENDYHRARMVLAAGGLPKSVPAGYAVLDNLPLGISRPVEAARLRQAQESDLAASIMAINGVESAQVHLAFSDASPFVRDSVAPTAAIFVKLSSGRALGAGQTEAIVHLVSASVAGLSADHVSVVDQSGRLLTAAATGRSVIGRAQLDYVSELEARYRGRIAALMLPLVGAGNFSSEVTLDIDFTRTQSTRERVEPGNVAVTSERGAGEALRPPPAAGIPGALSNIIPATPAAVSQLPKPAPPTPSSSSGDSYDRTFQVGRTIEINEPSEGALKRVSAGIILRAGAGVGAKQLGRVTNLVRDAIGFDPKRGDRVSVVIEPFADPPVPGADWWTGPLMQRGTEIGVPLVIALMVTFGVGRPLTKRWLAQPALSAGPQVHLLSSVDSHRQIEAVRVFVRENPATASRALRQLVRTAPAA